MDAALGLKRILEQKFVMEILADPVTVALVTSTQRKVSLKKGGGVDGAHGLGESQGNRDEGAGAGRMTEQPKNGALIPVPTKLTSVGLRDRSQAIHAGCGLCCRALDRGEIVVQSVEILVHRGDPGRQSRL